LNSHSEELMKATSTLTKSSRIRTCGVRVRRQDSIRAAAPEARAYVRVRSTKTFRRSLFKFASVFLTLCMLAPAAAAFASKGQKNYKQGLQYEAAQQWEKAAEEFSLAVAADPSNAEYQLHYRRAVFNASQLFAQQGASLMERGDYLGAYNAFRRAYGYDPANELARSMMERAFRLQMGNDEPNKAAPAQTQQATAKISPTVYATDPLSAHRIAERQDDSLPSSRAEQLSAVQFSGDLEKFIKYLARQLKLNVVFDRDFPRRNVEVDLQDVTAAQALDYVFLTHGLFFQKLSNRTILVADQVKRPQYQQLVLRTFYLYNVDPNDARALITASIPPQAGRQPVITANKATNSITVRDTPENVRLVSQLLKSIDKERAEVVMDVNIYEVSRADLMQFGNQIGNSDSLVNLGGIQKGLSVLGGSREVVTQAVATPTALGAALIVPATALSALQRKDNTRLVASTQVHAFDGEKSTAHIGQRVPVQTATVAPYGSVTTGDGNNNQPGVAQGAFGGNGYPVIQYEKTGLTLEFIPQVFPNLDVQVKMNIKSNDVTTTQGGPALTPTFTERNIEVTARIQNNRTMMIASVAQNTQSRGRQGLPVLGLVPVLGRMFTAPRRDDRQTDIVIAVTPHVMRASTVTPQDEEMRPSGTLQTPTTETLEAMLQEVNREEQLAAARALPTNARVELPASDEVSTSTEVRTSSVGNVPASATAPAPKIVPASVAALPSNDAAPSASDDTSKIEATTFIPAPKPLMNVVSEQSAERPAPREAVVSEPSSAQKPAAGNSLFSLEQPAQLNEPKRAPEASPSSETNASVNAATTSLKTNTPPASAALFKLASDPKPMYVGERRQLKLLLKTDAPLGLVALTLRLDPRVLSVHSVSGGTLYTGTDARLTHTFTPEGLLLVSLAPSNGTTAISGAGVLLIVEVEALANGVDALSFSADDVHLVATDGRKVLLRAMTDQISVGR
jgi:general secretion pathway protein D